MADILIRNIDSLTKERLRRRAKRHGRSLEADLRAVLQDLAQKEVRPAGQPQQGFGSWLVSISQPGADLSNILTKSRRAPVRRVDFGQ
jgi:hypothetical protein